MAPSNIAAHWLKIASTNNGRDYREVIIEKLARSEVILSEVIKNEKKNGKMARSEKMNELLLNLDLN